MIFVLWKEITSSSLTRGTRSTNPRVGDLPVLFRKEIQFFGCKIFCFLSPFYFQIRIKVVSYKCSGYMTGEVEQVDPLEMREIGEVIRKVRKERGMRLEDLADEHIFPATISNIERGVPHVSKDKVAYVLDKLGLSLDRLPEMMAGTREQKKLEDIRLQLTRLRA